MKTPNVTVGVPIDVSDQPEAPIKSTGPSVMLTFEGVKYEDRKVLMVRLRKHDGYLKWDVYMLEDKTGLVVSSRELVSLWSFKYHIASVLREVCLSFNSKIVVRSEVPPATRYVVSIRWSVLEVEPAPSGSGFSSFV